MVAAASGLSIINQYEASTWYRQLEKTESVQRIKTKMENFFTLLPVERYAKSQT
jgi:hypothetical protein